MSYDEIDDDDDDADEIPSIRNNDETAMQVFLTWEKLRLAYNAVLVVVVFVRIHFLGDELGLESLIPGALSANLCFCAGPIAEGYLSWIGLHRKRSRYFVFGVGLVLAVGISLTVPAHDLGVL